MPQLIHVVQCYGCQMYQVDIVKKVPKWTCKLCGEKQSLKTVLFQGSGKECRLHVQKLNELKGATVHSDFIEDVSSPPHLNNEPEEIQAQTKWSDFVDDSEDDTYDKIFEGSLIEHTDRACSNGQQVNKQEDRQQQFAEKRERNDEPSAWKNVVQAKRIQEKSNSHGEDDPVSIAKLRKIETNSATNQSEWDKFLPDELSDREVV